MTTTFSSQLIDNPVHFRVIGFGNETADVIRRLTALDYYGVEASLFNTACPVSPTDDDRMIILLAPQQSEEFHSIAESFYRAGVLTLAILTEPCRFTDEFLDSYTVTSSANFYSTTKALLDPICMHGYINFDFNDIHTTLAHSGRFIAVEATNAEKDRMANALSRLTKQLAPEARNEFERIALVLYYNPKTNLQMAEISKINDFLSLLPQETDAFWGVYLDENMQPDELRLSLIASGKMYGQKERS